ncbi:MAG: DUF2079 domain-containing protein [Bacteroidales bacterium]|nr:DUF2079 domain-containing protein [Bacteroidales bacterium]
MNNSKSRLIVIVSVISLFAVIYGLISLVNHYNFRTYALDLGAYTNALYDYIHFQWNDSTVFKETGENLLADHFDLYLIFFSPLSLLFGTYTLLIVQIIAILAGGLGVYKYFSFKPETRSVALMAMLYFYLFFGVFSAVSFDYHSNVVAASLLPWFFYFIQSRKIYHSVVLAVLILVAKENVSLWMSFICLGLLFQYRKDILLRKVLFFLFLFSLFYFVWITSVIMPAISNANAYPHFHYSCLGKNGGEAMVFLITHPFQAVKMLFINHIQHPNADFVKLELHVLLIISGIPLLIKKPQFLFMMIPIYFQKLFHDNYLMWGIDGQYSIEFAPLLAIGVFSVISDFKVESIKKWSAVAAVFLAMVISIRVMDNTIMFTNKSKIRLYQASHYSRNYHVAEIHKVLSEIPPLAVISAQSPFLPHLSLRPSIYQFPVIKDAEYILFSRKENPYPMDTATFNAKVSGLLNSPEWIIQFSNDHCSLLRKREDIKNPESHQIR